MGFFDSIGDAITHPLDTITNMVEHPLDPIAQATGGVFDSTDIGMAHPKDYILGNDDEGGGGGSPMSAGAGVPFGYTPDSTNGSGNNASPGHQQIVSSVDPSIYQNIFNKDVRGNT